MVYIDNSNIFSATQKFSARKKRFFNRVRDVNCRVNVGGLVQLAIGGRHLIHGKLYGSEPPALDTVWAAIRKEQIEVSVIWRSLVRQSSSLGSIRCTSRSGRRSATARRRWTLV